MFALGILIGLYAYSIFTLGLLFLLNPIVIIIYSILFISSSLYFYKDKFDYGLKTRISKIKFDNAEKLVIGLFSAQVLVNLVGALGPELSFDSLWYHLTFPKIYLLNHGISHIQGGLFYYSVIPKLTELIYTGELVFGSAILPKVTHLLFGLLSCYVIFKISRKYLDIKYSMLTVLLFYTNLVVGWESTTSYIDLTRTFYEACALLSFINFTQSRKRKDLTISGVMLGLAISVKLISLITIPIYVFLIFIQKDLLQNKIKNIFLFGVTAMLIPLPWFVFAFVHTGNPVFPLITNYETGQGTFLLNPLTFIKDIYMLFTRASDPISPMYIILFPIILFSVRKLLQSKIRNVVIFSILSVIIWYVTPQTGGGRFIVPFLPAISISAMYCVSILKNEFLKKYIFVLIIFVSMISIGYRSVANFKFVPVIIGIEKESTFLTRNLNFNFGDFYDTDNYFKNHLKRSDTVLLYGFHNLYYVDFSFIDSSYVEKGDTFDYIATQNTKLPDRFSFWTLVYSNPITHVNLYHAGGQNWAY